MPRPDEVEGLGNFMPKMADNADALIDWALSHIPQRAGPRRSKHKKRVLARETQRRAHAAQRKQQEVQAKLRKDVSAMYCCVVHAAFFEVYAIHGSE